jgi:hypothetical protein
MYTENTQLKPVLFQSEYLYVTAGWFWSVNGPE